ncbi:histidine phosphatase family protein [Xenorhabdus bovienii]|uniref:histidine phosphatase family protein n=1 Tax=Xenorhabdus bovienii TaxID=40576 RepID=UPI0023B2BA41|nr:histidine phosphatase family protein [Xenorhabdus bovienii]MDE9460329.1 phosphoglycerate mutase family protein [Xenorhabdus bovienii]MDE9468577.1 phosphoglycerate mutase family protein [Xenorhabdus bovienii]
MIILIRHATPKIDYSTCNSKLAQQRLLSYNETRDIDESEMDEFMASSLYQKIKDANPVVYSSPVGRAERTCQVLFQQPNNYFIKGELKEVDLEICHLPFIKMKVRSWFFFSRLVWILGIGKEKEKMKHAAIRANRVFKLLDENKNIVIVSHGYLIHYVKKELKKHHYNNIDKYKKGCFTVELYDK